MGIRSDTKGSPDRDKNIEALTLGGNGEKIKAALAQLTQ